MSYSTTSAIKPESAAKYPFLAHPPPPQKKRPIQPPPSPPSLSEFGPTPATRIRSSTFSAITAWAAHVQPGSPASISPRCPHSPCRRPSFGKTRRTSISTFRLPSASFSNITPTPTTAYAHTPSVRDFKADLTTVGYTSVFLQLPNTPISATVPLPLQPCPAADSKKTSVLPIPSSPPRTSRFSRFRSLPVLGSRGKSKSVMPSSPTKMKAKAAAASAAAIVKRKKAKYATRPPPLVNELALMQFADGGNIDDNIKRVMHAHTKAAGGIGVADVYRDGEGGIWWDQDEEWEYAHLLADGDESSPHATGEMQWVTFNGSSSPLATGGLVGEEERRGSVSTQDSDLDPKYLVQPSDMLDGDDLALFGSAVVPLATCKPAMSVLCVPCRPRRTAKHLRKPDFLIDIAFARLPLSPKSPFGTSSSLASAGVSKPKGKARRRPAPLKLFPLGLPSRRPTNSPNDADTVRRDFFEASFEPCITVSGTAAAPQTAPNVRKRPLSSIRILNVPFTLSDASSPGLASPMKKTMSKKPSMMNMIGLFRSSRKEDEGGRECTVH